MHCKPPRFPLAAILLQIAMGLLVAPLTWAAGEVDSRSSVGQLSATEAGKPAAAVSAAIDSEGVDWVVLAYRSGDAWIELEDQRGPARLRFEEGRVTGTAGCNRLMGAYVLKGEAIRFEPPMATTMMACPEPLMSQEQAIHAALASVASYRVDGVHLELLDSAGEPLLRLGVLRPLSLTGVRWQLHAYNNGKQAIVSVLAGTEITLELREDGTLGGSDGCNHYMSGFTLEDGRLTVGPIATTRMACRGPEGAAKQAAAYAAALGTVAGYRIEGDELRLVDEKGANAATFRVAD